jgi:DNA-directed RNA polymerase specialized sigma24 family protein
LTPAATRDPAAGPEVLAGPVFDGAVLDGTGEGFARLAEQHRRELHLHCYRMLASFDDAEDAVQETLLRAWRAQDSFEDRAVRAWLYRIATNVCLDVLRRRARHPAMVQSVADVPWLQPYPDRLLDEIAPPAPTRSSSSGRRYRWRSSRPCRCCRPGSGRR